MDNNTSDSALIYPSPDTEELILPTNKLSAIDITNATDVTMADKVTIYNTSLKEIFNKTQEQEKTDAPLAAAVPWALRMPNVEHPVAEYYTEINWDNGYEQWPLCRFATPMDGNCLFHAIANSFFSPYHKESLYERSMSRKEIVNTLRRELARRLSDIDPQDSEGRTHYARLANGNTAIFAEAIPEFKLEAMQAQLASHAPIGYGYMEFICNALNKDVYILEAARRDVYIHDELPFCIKGNRKSIVVYYMNGHYELVGIRTADGSFDTHFEPNHSFIRFLNGIVKEVTGRS